MSNRDRLIEAWGHLARTLGPYMSQRMAAAFPDGKNWFEVRAARRPSGHTGHSLSDPRFLLRLLTEE